MKKLIYMLSLTLLFLATMTTSTSCSKKTGCPAMDQNAKLKKNGMPKKKATSGVMPKSMSNKKMKKRRKPKKKKY